MKRKKKGLVMRELKRENEKWKDEMEEQTKKELRVKMEFKTASKKISDGKEEDMKKE